ncbi:Uncharacterised protein [Klebsiella pneumoniae]|nr:Uncharacterised protein [Klebsiella pneumoniae]SVL64728.1 Uncharacterised protein [Klebsiella pneumoniae]SVM86113.1 Uncharacterised protein [Klebsiella pneumoniae]
MSHFKFYSAVYSCFIVVISNLRYPTTHNISDIPISFFLLIAKLTRE